MRQRAFLGGFVLVATAGGAVAGEKFNLMTGVDARHYPAVNRVIVPIPGPGFPGTFNDGDRLAGTADIGPVVPFVGLGTPLFQPNQFGSMSFMFRRGSIPAGGPNRIPFMGIEFLGGPLLDLDGDLNNGVRSLVPILGETPVQIPNSSSFLELGLNRTGGTATLDAFDATGCNEGAPNIQAETATILVRMAGTGPQGQSEPVPNPAWDTRSGLLIAFPGSSGTVKGVYRILSLQAELWEDSIDPNSSSADILGTFQYFVKFNGWLVQRDLITGQFPVLSGEGLGPTRWPEVNTSQVGNVFTTANNQAGGVATIRDGVSADVFSSNGNGGLPLADFGGDLGAYLDQVVAPRVPANVRSYVYLESAGFGINNSFDPVFLDTVGYDILLLATGTACADFLACDANCDGARDFFDIDAFTLYLTDPDAYGQEYPGCDPLCALDVNNDGVVDFFDIDGFVACVLGGAP